MTGKSEITKILIVVAVLIILLIGIFIIRKNQTPQRGPGTETRPEETGEKRGENIIFLEKYQESVATGGELTVGVKFNAPGKNIFGADIILLYDPEYLAVSEEGVGASDFFSSMPRTSVDSENGIIKVTVFDGRDEILFGAANDLFSVDFKALKKGVTTIRLDFRPGGTDTTNLVERQTSQNILESVGSLTVDIK